MNFLQLAQRVRQEAGLSGTGPALVTGQAGEALRIVDWTRDAWTEIQGLQAGRWNWLWNSFSGQSMVVGQNVYSPSTDWSITPAHWEQMALDGARIILIEWALFRDLYPDPQDGVPTCAAVRPDGSVAFNAKPLTTHAITGEYYAKPQTLAAGTDVPLMDSRYHMAIVWRAVTMAEQYDEASVMQQMAERKFQQLYAQMVATDLPDVTLPAPLV